MHLRDDEQRVKKLQIVAEHTNIWNTKSPCSLLWMVLMENAQPGGWVQINQIHHSLCFINRRLCQTSLQPQPIFIVFDKSGLAGTFIQVRRLQCRGMTQTALHPTPVCKKIKRLLLMGELQSWIFSVKTTPVSVFLNAEQQMHIINTISSFQGEVLTSNERGNLPGLPPG